MFKDMMQKDEVKLLIVCEIFYRLTDAWYFQSLSYKFRSVFGPFEGVGIKSGIFEAKYLRSKAGAAIQYAGPFRQEVSAEVKDLLIRMVVG